MNTESLSSNNKSIELDIYNKLSAGTIDQAEAIQEIRHWFTTGGIFTN